jgi:hypothetical protein
MRWEGTASAEPARYISEVVYACAAVLALRTPPTEKGLTSFRRVRSFETEST